MQESEKKPVEAAVPEDCRSALRESERREKLILSAIPDLMFLFDREGKFTDFHATDHESLLMPPEEFLGRPAAEVLPPELAELTERKRAEALAGGRLLVYEYDLEIRGQLRHFECRMRPVCDEGVLAIVREITRRKRAQHEREHLIAELETKNAELDRFTYTVSHDLKSPLTTIQGFLQLLEGDLDSGNLEGMREDVRRIGSAVGKMEDLLDELLALSRIGRQEHPPEDVSLRELVGEVLALQGPPIQERGIEVTISPSLPTVRGDRIRIFEVYQNLLGNAVKFLGDQAEPRIEIGVRPEPAAPVLYVSDNGIGVDPKHHERIFELFHQLDARGKGSGVGLAIARRIVEVHGGDMWVESEGQGRGSTFCFTLPSCK